MDNTTKRGALLQIDDEPAQATNVVAIEVSEGESPHIVGGLPGWYAGDRAYRTSDGVYEKKDSGPKAGGGPGIVGDEEQSACAKARGAFKLNGPYELIPVFAPDLEGETLIQVPNQNLIRHKPTGNITSPHSVTDNYVLGKPEDMDVIGTLSGEVSRGGSMKNESLTYLSSAQETWTMPDGQEIQNYVSAFKDWSGRGADLIVRHMAALECRNVIKSVMSGSQNVWRFRHSKTGQANLALFAKIMSELTQEQARSQLLLTSWGKTPVTKDQLIKLFTDALPKKKDDDGKPTDVLTSLSAERLQRIEGHIGSAPGCNRGGDLTLWDGQQAASFDATHLFSNQTGLEGMLYGPAGTFMDRFTASANGLFVQANANTKDEEIHQAVSLLLN